MKLLRLTRPLFWDAERTSYALLEIYLGILAQELLTVTKTDFGRDTRSCSAKQEVSAEEWWAQIVARVAENRSGYLCVWRYGRRIDLFPLINQ